MSIFKKIGLGLLVAIFAPLFLALLFLMPADFAVASWQLTRLDGETEGVVISSRVGRHRSSTRSEVEYVYAVDGVSHRSRRIGTGFWADGYETNGDALAKTLQPGDRLTVYYAGKRPEFAVIAYGWPKWSIGFSAAVWGMLIGAQTWRRAGLMYAISRALTTAGFLCIAAFPQVVTPAGFGLLGLIFGAAVVAWALIYLVKGRLKSRKPEERA